MMYLDNQKGSQTIEFAGILPLFLLMIMILWQVTITAKAKIVVEAAAMEGARMAMVGGDYTTAINNVVNGYTGLTINKTERNIGAEEYVRIQVTVNAPLLNSDTVFKTTGLNLPVTGDVTLRKED